MSDYDVGSRLPADVRNRIIMHGQETPFHRREQDRLRKEDDMGYDDIETWDDLREAFGYIDEDTIVDVDKNEFVPDHYSEDELKLSDSCGTTGTPKELYWHERDVDDNVDYLESVLRDMDVPEDGRWVGTSTQNPVLTYILEETADRFDGEIDVVQVNPTPIKRAVMSGDRERMEEAFEPVAERVIDEFDEGDVAVYEDIPPLMQYVGDRLEEEQRDTVETLLVGGVGASEEMVETITEEQYKNADMSGWYGNFIKGLSPMDEPESFEYYSDLPDVRLEVRDEDNLDRQVEPGEEGEVVAHIIRRGVFLPNLRLGDRAKRVEDNGKTGVKDIGRV